MQEPNETVRISPIQTKKTILHLFDAEKPPYTVDLYSFGKREITLGRGTDRDIILSSPLVSRVHGNFLLVDDRWFVRNQNSTNGFIFNGANADEIPVEEDNFIRVDDGIETVPRGVLILFGTSAYSDTWESVPVSEWGNGCDLAYISAALTAKIEHSGNTYYITETVPNSGISINRKKLSGRMPLHEKDVIAAADCRLVFTSQMIYINRLSSCTALFVPAAAEQPVTGFTPVSVPAAPQPVPANPIPAVPIIPEPEPSEFAEEEEQYEEYEPYEAENISADEKRYDEPEEEQAWMAPPAQEQQYNETRQENYQEPYQSNTENSGSGFRDFLASGAGYVVLSIIIAAIIWGITVALWTSEGEAALVVILICAVFGWQALNSIQPAMFIWMSWTGWIIYFCVKFILSAMIGLFVAPFKIGKWIAGAISGSM